MDKRAAKEKPETSTRVTKRGFTLIELSVAIVVLALLSAIVAPRLLSVRSGQEARGVKFAIRELAREARLRAVQGGEKGYLPIEGSGERIELVQGEESVIRSIDVPSAVDFPTLRLGQSESGASEWELRFYADGRSDGGGLEIEHDGAVDSVLIGTDGTVTLLEGPLPEVVQESWPAGENEQRL